MHLHVPRPSLRSSLCLVMILLGFALTGCAAWTEHQRMEMAHQLVAAGDTAGAVAVAAGGPLGIIVGGLLIAFGHAGAALVRNNTRPPAPAAMTQPLSSAPPDQPPLTT